MSETVLNEGGVVPTWQNATNIFLRQQDQMI